MAAWSCGRNIEVQGFAIHRKKMPLDNPRRAQHLGRGRCPFLSGWVQRRKKGASPCTFTCASAYLRLNAPRTPPQALLRRLVASHGV